jgi:chaperonin GroES
MNALAAVTEPVQQHDPTAKLRQWINAVNIAEDLDDETLQRMGERVFREYNIDDNSRSDWKTKSKEAMDLALQVVQEKSFPWPRAANIIYPLVTTAAMQFAARAYPAIVNGRNVVRGVVIGDDNGTPAIDPRTGQPLVQPGPPDPQTGQPVPLPVYAVQPGEKQKRADQIGEHMSWQLLDEMPEWEPETDRLLHILPIVGIAPRKTYFDPAKGNCSTLVLPSKLVINYKAKSYETAPRITEELEFYPNEIREMELAGLWREPPNPYGMPEGGENGDDDAPHVFLEQHRFWDLDNDGYQEPYIVTIHKQTHFVVRIVARYEAEGIKLNRKGEIGKIEPVHYYTLYGFIPNPESAVYPLGFGQLLRPINEGINTTLNQLIDAGTLQNAGGGFIGKGLSMNAGAIRFQLGEYKTVNVTGSTLRDNIVPLDFKGPSPVLFELLGMLVESGKEIAAIKDVLTGDQEKGNVPATTTLALIEQGLKVFTAIYKRVHRSLKAEFAKLYRLNRIYGDEVAQYKAGDAWKQIAKQDYVQGSGVEPVSDPTMVSDMQRMGRAQFLGGFANDPMMNGMEIRRRILKAAEIEDIDKLFNPNPQPPAELHIKGMELEIKDRERMDRAGLIDAQKVQAYSSAILNLANADKAVGDQHIQWLDKVLRAWEAQFSAAVQPTKNADGTTSPGAAGPPPPHLPHPIMPGPPPSTDNQMAQADPDGNGRVSPSAAFAAVGQS